MSRSLMVHLKRFKHSERPKGIQSFTGVGKSELLPLDAECKPIRETLLCDGVLQGDIGINAHHQVVKMGSGEMKIALKKTMGSEQLGCKVHNISELSGGIKHTTEETDDNIVLLSANRSVRKILLRKR